MRRHAVDRRRTRPSSARRRRFLPSVQLLEERQLLVAGAFLQGTAYLDINANGALDQNEPDLSGAAVKLYSSDGSVLLGDTVTDANGYYRFDDSNVSGHNLQAGTYRIVETPPAGAVNTGAQVLSNMDSGSVLAANTVQVTLINPSNLSLTYTGNGNGENATVVGNGVNEATFAGQLRLTLSQSGTTVAQLTTNCIDLFHQVSGGNTFAVLPEPVGASFGPHGGQMAYLYNHYGQSTTLTAAQAAGLQIALWELEVDAATNLDAGVFQATSAGVDAAALAAANAYLAESVGKSESALFLDATLGGQSVPSTGRQGQIASGSFNFGNAVPPPPLGRISGSVYIDINNDGKKAAGEQGLGGVTVTLTGTQDQGGAVAAVVTTASNGAFDFGPLRPGTYMLTETPPAAYIDAKKTVGNLGGTAGDRSFSNIRLLGGDDGKGYLFGEERAPEFKTKPITLVSVPQYPTYTYSGGSGGSGGMSVVEYDYQAGAADPDQDALTYSLLRGPSGMAVDPATGLVTWMPPQVSNSGGYYSGGSGGSGGSSPTSTDGDYNVALGVSDGRGGTAEQDYVLKVIQQAPNMPPIWTSTPVVDANVATPYAYQGAAWDADLDALTYSVYSGPAGLTIDQYSGLVSWTPTAAQLGLNPVVLKVADGYGAAALQSFTIVVGQAPGNHAPAIVSQPPTPFVLPPPGPEQVGGSIFLTGRDPDFHINEVGANNQGARDIITTAIGYVTDPAHNPFAAHGVHKFLFVESTGPIPNVGGQGRGLDGIKSAGYVEGTDFDLADATTLPAVLDKLGTTYDAIVVASDFGGALTQAELNILDARSAEIIKFLNAGGGLFAMAESNQSGLTPDGGRFGFLPFVVATTALSESENGDSVTAFGSSLGLSDSDVQGNVSHNVFDTTSGLSPVDVDPQGNILGLAGRGLVTSSGVIDDPASVYTYQVRAVDADDDPMTYSLVPGQPPDPALADMSIDPGTGLITWSPTPADAGPHVVTILVQDGRGGSATQQYTLTVVNGEGEIRGTVFADRADNGVQAVTDPGLSGWTVYLDQNDNGHLDPGESTATTDLDGNYAFTDLGAGPYFVAIAPPADWVQTAPISGDRAVTLSQGQVTDGVDFGASWNNPGTGDASPSFSTAPDPHARVGVIWIYPAQASDPDGDPLTYDLPVAPAGMAVDPATGVVAWAPTADEVGAQSVIIRARDGNGGVALQPFVVTARLDIAPVFTSGEPLQAVAGVPLQYQFRASDSQGDPITFTLGDHPAGMTITDGVLSWPSPQMPAPGDGPWHVAVTADDGQPGGTTTLSFYLTVVDDADTSSIQFVGAPPATIQLGRTYVAQVQAVDSDGDPLAFAQDTLPSGMTLSTAGLITWTPTPDEFGSNTVGLHVSDGRGGYRSESFTIQVVSQEVNRPPTIDSQPTAAATVGQTYVYQPHGTDPDGDTLSWSLAAWPAGMVIDPVSGVVIWTPTADELGAQNVTIRVDDGQGGWTTQPYSITARGSVLPPQIRSTPDTRAAQGQDYRYQVVAVDPQGDPLTYTLTNPPIGMTIGATGLLDWPNPSPTGNQSVAITVTNSQGAVAPQTYTLVVGTTAIDAPPLITSKPGQYANVGSQYQYAVVATSPAGLALSYSLPASAPGMQINQTSGLITWTPQAAITNATVTVEVADTAGGFASQTYTITAAAANTAPTIAAIPAQSATVGAPFSYAVAASDGDGDTAFTYVVTGATGLAVDAAGRITWTPGTGDVGTKTITVVATDLYGLSSAPKSFTIAVSSDVTPPQVQVQEDANPADMGAVVTFLVTTQDAVPVTAMTLTVGGIPVALDAHGAGRLLMPNVGNFTIVATATDAGGQTGQATDTLAVINPADTSMPTATIGSPGDQATVTAPTTVTGTASDSVQVTSWTLSAAPVSGGPSTVINSGMQAVGNGPLGTFDPTMLADGAYYLILTVTNAGGFTSSDERLINVAGHLKLGNLHLSFNDLAIPVAGIPITITRTYDTLNANTKGDFGYGWTLSEGDFQLQVSEPDGTFQGAGVLTPFQAGARVTLTRPGMDPEGFTFEPQEILSSIYTGSQYYKPFFVPDPGVSDTLSVNDAGEYDVLTPNGDGTYSGSDADGTPYNPADSLFGGTYTLTTHQGLAYVLDASTGQIDSEGDRNGNTLTFQDDGIYSDSGRAVTFTRDPITHDITAITDPNGHSIVYAYNSAGDLVSVTDRNGGAPTQFFYQSTAPPHFLDHVTAPSGQVAVQADYGADHRVDGLTDALGNKTTLGYNLGNLSETSTAPGATASSTISFDSRGNVIGAVDADDNASSATYVGDDLTSQTQVVGTQTLTTTYTYDDNGNVKTATDANHNTTYFYYNQFGQPTSSTDALGDTTLYGFDGDGNLISTTSPAGVTTSMTYYANGQVQSTTTPDGTTSYTYDAFGDVLTSTDAHGATTTYTYDANGNEKSSSWTWIDPSNANHTVVVSTTNIYDNDDHLIETDAPDGVTKTYYDADGNVYKTIDDLGGETDTIFDADGRAIQTKTPDGKISDTVYDTQGRVVWTDAPHAPGQPADGDQTTYDNEGRVKSTARFANVAINVSTPVGDQAASAYASKGASLSATSTVYDAAGRVTSTTDAANHTTTYKYDASGNQIEVDDTANGAARSTTSIYDAAGRLTSTTDALDHTTKYVHDADGRLIETDYFDGTSTQTKYDANGRKVATIDQADAETDYEYDALGDLTAVLLPAVTDPATGQSTRPTYHYTYDAYGDLLTESDPLAQQQYNGPGVPPTWNPTTSYAYDAFGRKTSETLPTLPNGDTPTETWSYNGLGQLASSTDFDGDVTDYTYDAVGRVYTKTVYAKNSSTAYDAVTYTYDAPDPNGDGGSYDTVSSTLGGATTSYYDVHGDLVKLVSPQGTINYTYYAATGAKKSVATADTDVQYAYNDLGQLTGVTADTLDGASASQATIYAYDADGDLTTTTLPNGTVETRSYDALGRLASIKTTVGVSGPVVFSAVYTRNRDGRVLTDAETTAAGTRSETYTYDDDGRLLTETITDPTAGNRTLTYTYDLAGNRVASTDSGAPSTQQSLTYAYDADGRLTTVTGGYDYQNGGQYALTYTYDDAGNTLTVTSGNQVTTNAWDPEGRLAGVVTAVGGATTRTVSYTYDDAGGRTSETVDGQKTTYLNDPTSAYDQALEEYAPGGVLAATYVRGLDLLFQDRTAAGGGSGRSYYAVDQLGTTRALTNASGAVTDAYTYDAYGDLIGSTGTTTNEYLYAGYQADAATGLDYLHARYYDAAVGQFTSRDSYDGSTADPITENHYAYANDEPTTFVDRSGHDSEVEAIEVSGIQSQLATLTIRGTNILRAQGRLFAAGVGTAFSRGGALIERLADRVFNMFGGAVQILRTNVGTYVRGTIDRLVQIGSRNYLIEIKSTIDSTSKTFPRAVIQLQRGLDAIEEGIIPTPVNQFVVWSFRAPSIATLNALMEELGPAAFNRIQFVSGIQGLYNWITMMLGLG